MCLGLLVVHYASFHRGKEVHVRKCFLNAQTFPSFTAFLIVFVAIVLQAGVGMDPFVSQLSIREL
jgi:hypothetical protein